MIMKKNIDVLKEYTRRLSDDEIKFLNMRFSNKLSGDEAEAIDFISRNEEMNKFLGSASNSSDFFEILNQIDAYIQQETKKRFGFHESKK